MSDLRIFDPSKVRALVENLERQLSTSRTENSRLTATISKLTAVVEAAKAIMEPYKESKNDGRLSHMQRLYNLRDALAALAAGKEEAK